MDGSRSGAGTLANTDRMTGDACRVIFAASEIFPLVKTGGLADVCSSLPRALADRGCDIRLLMPAYPQAVDQLAAPRLLVELGTVMGHADVRVLVGRMPDSGLPVWLVDAPVFRRRGGPYLDDAGCEWPDNPQRFALFCHVAARLARDGGQLAAWQPDVVHCHDWHTGLVPLLLAGHDAPRTVFTIHNAAFQGNVPLQAADALHLPAAALGMDGAEFHGQLSLLKAGIRYADRVTTVSPTYARELLGPVHGCGMDGLLRHRADVFSGILNGIDTMLWNPQHNRHLPRSFSAAAPAGKADCKLALQAELGLAISPERPLAIMLSRLTHQKMADTVLQQLPAMLAADPRLQFALHGRGEREYEDGFMALAADWPERVAVRIGYDEPTAHRLHAGADLLLHGSRFEPCGLVQMYAMRYGTVPVVSRVGGLADTVTDPQGRTDGTGFVFDGDDGAALRDAVDRALRAFHAEGPAWSRLRRNAMQRDFSWNASARRYAALYGDTAATAAEPTRTVRNAAAPRQPRLRPRLAVC
jgi:starch synthase